MLPGIAVIRFELSVAFFKRLLYEINNEYFAIYMLTFFSPTMPEKGAMGYIPNELGAADTLGIVPSENGIVDGVETCGLSAEFNGSFECREQIV